MLIIFQKAELDQIVSAYNTNHKRRQFESFSALTANLEDYLDCSYNKMHHENLMPKAALRRAFYACVYCMWLHFQRNYVGWLESGNNFKNATVCGKRTLKMLVATQLQCDFVIQLYALFKHNIFAHNIAVKR